jgi:peptide/nickel transport system substrate-binding protein
VSRIEEGASGSWLGVIFNNAFKPFDDPRVREALTKIIDRQAFTDIAMFGHGTPTVTPIPPTHPFFRADLLQPPDIPGAKKLLAEAGKPNGFDTEIFCKSDPDWEPIAVQAMVNMWKQIGVNVKINVLPSAQYWDIWNQPSAPFAFTTWTHRPLGTMVLGLAYRSNVPWNESHWSNKQFDELLSKAEGLLDVEKRKVVMKDIEKLMLEEGPICIPLWRAFFTPMDKAVKGFKAHPTAYMFAEEWSLQA